MTMFVSFPRFRAEDGNGGPLVGGKVYTYDPGTTNAKATYSDKGLSVANTNPVILDARGEADIYCGSAVKLVVKDADDVTLTTTDDWESVDATDYVVTLTGTQTLTNKTLTAPVITDASGSVVTTTATQTLTNKTLTSPVINTPTIAGGSITTATAAITGGTISGITDLAVADGGTGASTAAGARTALGVGPRPALYDYQSATGQTITSVLTTFLTASVTLESGDLLMVDARVYGTKGGTGGAVEVEIESWPTSDLTSWGTTGHIHTNTNYFAASMSGNNHIFCVFKALANISAVPLYFRASSAGSDLAGASCNMNLFKI
jgi:hypothetical protein